MARDKGWEFLFREYHENDTGKDDDGNDCYIYSDGSGVIYGTDGGTGYLYSDGSGVYYGADGSTGYKNKDGSGVFYGTDGNTEYKSADDSYRHQFSAYCGRKSYTSAPYADVDLWEDEEDDDDEEVYVAPKRTPKRKKSHGRQESGSGFAVAILCLLIAVLIPAVFLLGMRIDKENAEAAGKISAGYYGDLVGEDYDVVEAHFRAAGFTNIELIDLEDAGLAFWRDGKVDMISVGGNTDFDSTDYFYPDTKVIISYH